MKKYFIFLSILFMINLSANDVNDDFDSFEEEMQVEEISDPLKPYNRVMTNFNDNIYENIFIPLNKGYKVVTTNEVRKSIDKFFKNLAFPMRFLNNTLQMKFHYAFEETGRFVVNSTAGVLGFFDPAKSEMNLKAHDEDFGQTLGFYGLGSGPHLVLPIFGPSNLRDFSGLFVDSALSPVDYKDRHYPTLTNTWASYIGVRTTQKFNEMSLFSDTYDKVKKDAVDLYPYLRNIYEQRRNNQIKE